MNSSWVRSQPSPRSGHGSWIMHLHPHDALADPLPFGMQDTWSLPVGCSGLAFRELIQPTLSARGSWTWTGLVKIDGLNDSSSRGVDVPPRPRRDGHCGPLHRSRSPAGAEPAHFLATDVPAVLPGGTSGRTRHRRPTPRPIRVAAGGFEPPTFGL